MIVYLDLIFLIVLKLTIAIACYMWYNVGYIKGMERMQEFYRNQDDEDYD